MKIDQFLPDEKPRERCLQYGPETLSLRECLAILLGSGPKGVGCFGLADEILKLNDYSDLDESNFFKAYETDPLMGLQGIQGLGPAGKAKILVALELCKRHYQHKNKKQNKSIEDNLPIKVKNKIPKSMHTSTIETLGFVPCFQDGSVGEFIEIQKGEETFVSVSTQRLIRSVLLSRAIGFWLFHNHPSGDTMPSNEDKAMTRNVRAICRQLQIGFKGHWVVSHGNFLVC